MEKMKVRITFTEEVLGTASADAEIHRTYTIVGQHGNRMIAYGFTYTKSKDTNYALFIYSHISDENLHIVRCYNGKWTSTNLVK